MPIATVLRLNAASCIGFGGLFVLMPESVSGFLGAVPGWLLVVLGLGLILNGAHLLWAAHRGPSDGELVQFALGDAGWVVATVVILLVSDWITTPAGIAASLIIAAFVGVMGLLQWRARAQTAV